MREENIYAETIPSKGMIKRIKDCKTNDEWRTNSMWNLRGIHSFLP